jgi:hypothetical protein
MHLNFPPTTLVVFAIVAAFASADYACAQSAPSAPVPAQSTPAPAVPTPAPTVPTPPAAQANAKETVVVKPDALANPDEIVCKTSPPPTGTRLGATRQCLTARDWARRQEEAQRILSKAQTLGNEGMIPPPGGGGH